MKIITITPEFPPVWGGVGTYSYQLTRELSNNRDIEKIYVVTPNRGITKYAELGDNVEIVHTNPPTKDQVLYYTHFQLEAFNKLCTILEKDKIDIIHFHAHLPDLIAGLLKKNKNIPIVTTVHILNKDNIYTIMDSQGSVRDISENVTLVMSPAILTLENMYFKKRLAYYITVSKWMKKKLATNYSVPDRNIMVTYNGVDYNVFKPRPKQQAMRILQKDQLSWLIEEDKTNVLFLSRLVGRKGIFTFLSVIDKIVKSYDVEFIFAGSGGKGIVELINSHKNTRYLGYVPENIKPYIYNLADIFVLPSFYENFPISVLEAMASETAVVATNVGGIPEMITSGYNGILVPPKDVDSLANALIMLIENDYLRKKMGRNARKTVLRKFTWKKTAELTKEYYEEILEG